MCGIVGYVGSGAREAAPILLGALRRLEYRGSDSAGIAVHMGRGLVTRKVRGRVEALSNLLSRLPVHGSCGIAHTRWATHGAPSERNAHPHLDCRGRVAVVHNGIIDNVDTLRDALGRSGHQFYTETDTETLAHLIEEAPGETLEARVIAALSRVEGNYAIAVLSADEPEKMVVARRGSPMLLGVGEGEYFATSDASVVLEHTRSLVQLEDGDVAVLSPAGYRVLDRQARPQERFLAPERGREAVVTGRSSHLVLREICGQPEAVRGTLRGRLLPDEGAARLDGLGLSAEECAGIRRISILGCGTAWHAGLVGRDIIEALAGVPVQVEQASEFRARRLLRADGTLTIAVSQSGETVDTLEAMRAARTAGSRVVGIVNVVGSTIAREADSRIYLHAGPDIGVASPKAFTSQIVGLLLLGLYLGRQRGLPLEEGQALVRQLAELPEVMERALALEPIIKTLALEYAAAESFLYLGRGVSFPVALEGALKLKELSQIHAEGYPAAEMKHGPIALIDEAMPVVFVAPKDGVYQKVLSNMQEVKTRGGRIIALTSEGNGELGGLVDHQVRVPATVPLLSAVVTVIPLQLLAYHVALLRGRDVEPLRKLATSVNVE
jgi:glutamine---fructose-6-phosphate transaminase (isomerizing)